MLYFDWYTCIHISIYTKQLNKTIIYLKANIDIYKCIDKNLKNEKYRQTK